MQRTILDPDLSVDEIMRRWPATIRLFLRNSMVCVGCPIGVFHTVTDAYAAHSIDQGAFEAELLAATLGFPVAEPEVSAATRVTERVLVPRGRGGS